MLIWVLASLSPCRKVGALRNGADLAHSFIHSFIHNNLYRAHYVENVESEAMEGFSAFQLLAK